MKDLNSRGALERLLSDFRNRRPIRTGSLIVTILGDVVAPHDTALWLAGLTDLLSSFGISDTQVRSAVSRLVGDDWIVRSTAGRRSLYRLSETGSARVSEAARRIYAGKRGDWPGSWQVILLPGGPGEDRDTLRNHLGWLGYGAIASNVLLHPMADPVALEHLLEDLPPSRHPIVIDGQDALRSNRDQLRRVTAESWELEVLAADYGEFIARFGPLRSSNEAETQMSPIDAVLARIMMIHDFRRLVLRDPQLPAALLPDGWIGDRAQALCRDLYRTVLPSSETWLEEHLLSDVGRAGASVLAGRFATPENA